MSSLEPLNKHHLLKILTDVKNSIVEQVQELFSMDNIQIEFGPDYLDRAAEFALEKKLGARALKSVVEQSLINTMFRAPGLRDSGVSKIIFHKYPVSADDIPELVYQDGTVKSDTDYKFYRGFNEKTQKSESTPSNDSGRQRKRPQ